MSQALGAPRHATRFLGRHLGLLAAMLLALAVPLQPAAAGKGLVRFGYGKALRSR